MTHRWANRATSGQLKLLSHAKNRAMSRITTLTTLRVLSGTLHAKLSI